MKFKKPFNFALQWHVTERCNWHCKHCYQKEVAEELSLPQLYSCVDQFFSLIKKLDLPAENLKLRISGGEPLIRKDFFPFIERISKYSNYYQWYLMSNGSLFTEENLRKIKRLRVSGIQVSLEGTEKNNDEVRGKGTFKKTIKAMKLLSRFKIPFAVSLTLTKKNSNDIFHLVELLNKLGAYQLNVRRLVPQGRGRGLKNNMMDPLSLRDECLKIKEINKNLAKQKNKLRVSLGCDFGIFNSEILNDVESDMVPNYCGLTEGNTLTIMANGDVVPCRKLPLVLGNILEDELVNIYNSSLMKNYQKLDNLSKVCKNCPNFISCFGGAKCVTYGYSGRLNIADVQCWRASRNYDH